MVIKEGGGGGGETAVQPDVLTIWMGLVPRLMNGVRFNQVADDSAYLQAWRQVEYFSRHSIQSSEEPPSP